MSSGGGKKSKRESGRLGVLGQKRKKKEGPADRKKGKKKTKGPFNSREGKKKNCLRERKTKKKGKLTPCP